MLPRDLLRTVKFSEEAACTYFPKSYRISGFGELRVKPSCFLPELRSFLSGLDGELLHFLRRAIGPFRDWWHAEHLRALGESWDLNHGAGCGHRARQGPP